MRATIALMALFVVAGCYGTAEDPTSAGGRDYALEGAGGGKAPKPSKDEAPNADKEKVPNTEAKGCVATPPPAAPDDREVCHAKAKECYGWAKDPGECDWILKQCEAGTPAGPIPDSQYEACVIKAKDCYNWSKDPGECEQLLKQCEIAFPQPSPTPSPLEGCRIEAKKCVDGAKDPEAECRKLLDQCDREECVMKAKDCYSWEGADPKECDALLTQCDKFYPAPPPDAKAAVAACYSQLAECYTSAAAEWVEEKCVPLRDSCNELSTKLQ